MMNTGKLIGWIGVSVLALLANAQVSPAEDGMQCHDLPAKKAVLDEGREFLRSHSSQHQDRPLSHPDVNAWRSFSYFSSDINEAEFREELRRWSSSYSEVLARDNFSKMSEQEQASTMENLARVKIVLGLSNGFDFDFFRQAWRHGPQESYYYDPIIRDQLVSSILHTEQSKEDFQNIESLNAKSVDLRANFGPTHNFVADLLLAGALVERKNKSSEAYSLFLRACKIDRTALNALAGMLYRNPSSLQYVEKDLDRLIDAKSEDSASLTFISILIHSYIANKQNDKAIKMYEKYCSSQGTKVPLSAATILSLIEILPETDTASLRIHIAQISDSDPSYEQNYVAYMQKLRERGWTHEPDSTCDTLMLNDKYDANKQLAVASWYAQSKNDSRFLNSAKAVLIAMKNDSDDRALTYLSRLQKLLSTVANDRPEFREVDSEAKRITAYREDQVRRKQCLNMAQQLDKTAFDLEKSDHPEMASKLYKESLGIKQANLSTNDPETAMQIIDLARTAAAQHQYAESGRQYEKALSMMKKSPHTDPDSLISALESYGMMLNDSKQEAKANAVYEEAKQLHNKMSKSNSTLRDEILK